MVIYERRYESYTMKSIDRILFWFFSVPSPYESPHGHLTQPRILQFVNAPIKWITRYLYFCPFYPSITRSLGLRSVYSFASVLQSFAVSVYISRLSPRIDDSRGIQIMIVIILVLTITDKKYVYSSWIPKFRSHFSYLLK